LVSGKENEKFTWKKFLTERWKSFKKSSEEGFSWENKGLGKISKDY